jgi:hypothetical protein
MAHGDEQTLYTSLDYIGFFLFFFFRSSLLYPGTCETLVPSSPTIIIPSSVVGAPPLYSPCAF